MIESRAKSSFHGDSPEPQPPDPSGSAGSGPFIDYLFRVRSSVDHIQLSCCFDLLLDFEQIV